MTLSLLIAMTLLMKPHLVLMILSVSMSPLGPEFIECLKNLLVLGIIQLSY